MQYGLTSIRKRCMSKPDADPLLCSHPGAYNGKTSLAILCPITNQVKGYPFEVAVPAGLDVKGVILADQVKSMDWRARNAALICPLPTETVDAILQRVGTLLTRKMRLDDSAEHFTARNELANPNRMRIQARLGDLYRGRSTVVEFTIRPSCQTYRSRSGYYHP